MTIKVLNLYAGIGGNRKLWEDVEVTAVENNPEIAKIYQDFFPNDKVIVADAHKYLLEHYKEFDFIWSSPPCPSHSRVRMANLKQNKPIFPDLKLYEEIIFLKYFFKGRWVVENVRGYYNPLIKPQELSRHYFWANFKINNKKFNKDIGGNKTNSKINFLMKQKGININFKCLNKIKVLRNYVFSPLALHIFNEAFKVKQKEILHY